MLALLLFLPFLTPAAAQDADPSRVSVEEGHSAEELVAMGLAAVHAEQFAEAVGFWSQACAEGEMAGCDHLGFLYSRGQGVPQDSSRAAELYRQACEGGEMRGCYNLAGRYAFGDGVPRDKSRAAELYGQSCEGSYRLGCRELGDLYFRGEGVPQDTARANGFWGKACELGDTSTCDRLQGHR